MHNFNMLWRRALNLKTIRIHGVLVHTDKANTPHSVRNALFKGDYELHECQLVERVIRPQQRVLEIGTGIGLVSLLATKLAGEGNVLSCEANPALETAIRSNYTLNGWKPRLRMVAVAKSAGDVSFHQNDNLLSSSRFDRKLKGNKITVASVAINDLIAEQRPQTIIMDVEGSETELLACADLTSVSSIIVEMHPHIVGADAIDALVRKLEVDGFRVSDQRHKTYLLQRN